MVAMDVRMRRVISGSRDVGEKVRYLNMEVFRLRFLNWHCFELT